METMGNNEKHPATGREGRGETKKKRRAARKSRNANGSGTLVKHGKYYHARWRVGGKLVSQSLRTDDLATARAELARLSVPRAGQSERETLRKIAGVMAATMSDVSDQMKVASIPVRDLFKLFRDAPNRSDVGERTLSVYAIQFHVFTEWLARTHPGIVNARDISQGVADEYARWRAATKSPNTHNKDLNLFAQAWRLLGPRYGLDYNPWTDERIARLKLQPQHRRNLTRAECKAVMAAATLEERAMIEIALRTALRLGDVVRLKWRDIDMERLWLTRVNRKTGRTTAVPIVKPLAETLDAWRRESGGPDGPDDWVFPAMVARIRPDGDTENVSEIFSRLFRRAGIQTSEKLANGRMTPRATFHSLRHTFITNLIEAGVDPLLVRDAAGHSVMATTAGYTHIGEKTLRRAIARSAK